MRLSNVKIILGVISEESHNEGLKQPTFFIYVRLSSL